MRFMLVYLAASSVIANVQAIRPSLAATRIVAMALHCPSCGLPAVRSGRTCGARWTRLKDV